MSETQVEGRQSFRGINKIFLCLRVFVVYKLSRLLRIAAVKIVRREENVKWKAEAILGRKFAAMFLLLAASSMPAFGRRWLYNM